MASYDRGIFKQLEEMTLKCERLEQEMRLMRISYERQIKDLKDSYEAQIRELKLEIKIKDEKIAKLEDEVSRLKTQLSKDSSNSSKSPSTDNINKKNIINNREKSTKKPGGQYGHKGFSLNKKDIENKIKSGVVEHVIVNHGISEENNEYVSKYIVDTKTVVVVTEHRFYADERGKIVIPKEYQTDVQYGNNLKTEVVMLNNLEVVALERLTDFISATTNNIISMSTGTIMNFIKEFSNKSMPYIGYIENQVLNGDVMLTDSTETRCDKKKLYIRNYSNGEYTLYKVSQSKSKATINKENILPRYMGTLVHDHETVMYNYGKNHGECNVHLIRYLKANSENTKNEWSSDMISYLCYLNEYRKELKTNGIGHISEEELEKYSKRYDEILEDGFESNSTVELKYAKKDEQTLLNRLRKYKDNHLLFLYDFDVPFDNNMSERDLRHVKTKNKVSGCFRSLEGAESFANIRSIISTLNKQAKDIYSSIKSIFDRIPISI